MRAMYLLTVSMITGLGWTTEAFAADYQWAPCNVGNVRVMSTRLTVYCEAPYSGDQAAFNKDVPYYSISFKEAGELRINALMQAMVAAKVHKRKANVRYSVSHTKNPSGCKGSNCRRLEAFVLK